MIKTLWGKALTSILTKITKEKVYYISSFTASSVCNPLIQAIPALFPSPAS